jgi:hypothetical protein
MVRDALLYTLLQDTFYTISIEYHEYSWSNLEAFPNSLTVFKCREVLLDYASYMATHSITFACTLTVPQRTFTLPFLPVIETECSGVVHVTPA